MNDNAENNARTTPDELRSTAQNPPNASFSRSQLVTLCALGLAICFFLPWMKILFGKPSGFDFAKVGEKYLLLWALPIFSVITVVAGISNQKQRALAQMTAAIPFALLGLGIYDVGTDLLKVLEIGAYAGLGLGLVMFVAARGVK